MKKSRTRFFLSVSWFLTFAAFLCALAYAATSVQFGPNIRLGGFGNRQVETSIAANPADSRNLVLGFMDTFPAGSDPRQTCQSAFTTNGGATYTLGGTSPLQRLPTATGIACVDPSLTADLAGNFYFAYLNFNLGLPVPADLFVAKSTDGGRTFPTYTVAVAGNDSVNEPDKPYIVADVGNGSPFKGSLYLSYTDLAVGYSIRIVSSRDGGHTWSSPVRITNDTMGSNIFQASVPVVASDGTIYVFFSNFTFGVNGSLSIQFSKSSDGGISWSAPSSVASHLPSPGLFVLDNGDPNFGEVADFGVGSNSFPSPAVAPDGTLYVAWADFPEGSCKRIGGSDRPSCGNADVRLSVSRNGGNSWTAPVKVSDDSGSGTDQFFPWIAVHPTGC
ncbi:MAG TPA: sialidase family protein [Candidatus Polarisedimenticolia bacterium]|jgi:hypothetical protein|nr:sialidase family protein [Candidatus Polarisedimenticolia bacterium]